MGIRCAMADVQETSFHKCFLFLTLYVHESNPKPTLYIGDISEKIIVFCIGANVQLQSMVLATVFC